MASPTSPRVSAVVFDLGGVLIDWNPRYLYRTLFDDDEAMEEFLATVTTQEWNRVQDAGRPWAEAVEELAATHPEKRDLIEAYWRRWPETLGDEIEPTVALLDELRSTGIRLYASIRSRFSGCSAASSSTASAHGRPASWTRFHSWVVTVARNSSIASSSSNRVR